MPLLTHYPEGLRGDRCSLLCWPLFWCAVLARAGEFDEAWEVLLANYGQPHGFPEHLKAFLKRTGFISPEGVVE
ncbi:MAG TPA: hypothetical protein QGI62_09185 [Anaerolineales bacterium]|jgi:hypothetical protein|nr:hypothetical protein [Anaerolineales bacterium]